MTRMTHVQSNIGFTNPDEARAFANGLIAAYPMISIKIESWPVQDAGEIPDTTHNALIVEVGATGADPATPAEPTAAEPQAVALTLPQQKKAKELFNKFLNANGIAAAAALLAKYSVRRWSELTPEQMSLVATELAGK
jgi:hypothetical protein